LRIKEQAIRVTPPFFYHDDDDDNGDEKPEYNWIVQLWTDKRKQ